MGLGGAETMERGSVTPKEEWGFGDDALFVSRYTEPGRASNHGSRVLASLAFDADLAKGIRYAGPQRVEMNARLAAAMWFRGGDRPGSTG